jgi:tRNA 2-thiouridine synthesizing protein D
MDYQLNIYGAPWSSNSASDAISFAKESLRSGHSIKRIFFFFDGVYHGLASQSPASDEYALLEEWKMIASEGVELLLCIAASANRGVLSEEEAKRYEKTTATISDCFEITGLGQWASGFHDVDRIMSFK